LSRRALIVDDDAFVCGLLVRQLQAMGVQSSSAGDGEQARSVFAAGVPFDLVICDLKMPGVDGVELLRDLAEHQPTAALILISSADTKVLQAAGDLASARRLRVLGTLQKPIDGQSLKAMLARLDESPGTVAAARRVQEVSAEDLRGAIERAEIEPFMQPQIDLRSGRLAGVESLARWRRADGSMIPPDAFIGVAERSGQIDALTNLVLRRSLTASRDWQKAGLSVRVSVNFAAASLGRLARFEEIVAATEEAGLKADDLTVEVTESGLMHDLTSALDVLTRLRLRGFHLSIDDFGTGYSSLQQLQRVPFTELKIDRSFVSAAVADPGSRDIVESSIRLAQRLKIRTVAEGVETEPDCALLRQMDCDLGQGYFFARPMPAADIPAWATRWKQAAPG
jgi:EAL domain-containing protein (putative c-di-GMP-specific phosphodiesterase class I)/FixJ family two-component response regulator